MALATTGQTIRPEEAAHFGRLAAEWWDPRGSSAMLHRLNPVRLGFIRAAIDAHWPGAAASLRPLAGKRALSAFYSTARLMSTTARKGWVEPDLAPLSLALVFESIV